LADRPLVVGIDGRELAGRPTGTGRYLRNLLRHWREGDDQLLVYFNGPPALDPVLDHPRIRKRALGDGAARGLVFEQWILPREARADSLDVFFSPAYSCPLALGRPRVTAVHDLSFFACPQDFTVADALRRRMLAAPSMRASSRIPVCSDFTARELRRLFPELADRAVHVPLGADGDLQSLASRAEARTALGVAGPLILSVGAIFNRRCLPELLRATARLRDRYPALVLEIVGDNRTHPRLDVEGLVAALGREAAWASAASWTTASSRSATPPPTSSCRSRSTRASAFPRSKRPRAACRSSSASRPRSARSSRTRPS
jgi:glycosyltransferase involved in cell wall biosynthesis